MSLFDVLRYPISMPPTMEEFAALPDDVFKSWVDHPQCAWKSVSEDSRYDRFRIVEWMQSQIYPKDRMDFPVIREIEKDLDILRRIIQEREE